MGALQGTVCSPQGGEPFRGWSVGAARGLPGLSLYIHEIDLGCGQIHHKYQQVNFSNTEAIPHQGILYPSVLNLHH